MSGPVTSARLGELAGDGRSAPEPEGAAVRYGVPIVVRVPATSANLGPGFDSLGLAYDLYDVVIVEAFPAVPGEPTAVIEVDGEGAGRVPDDESHLVVRSIRGGLVHAGAAGSGVPAPGLRLRCRNVIPHGRGLGSSSAAIVAGLTAARGLLADPSRLDEAAVFELASAVEGHPDNAAATVFGGFTVAWTDAEAAPPGRARGRARAVQVPVAPQVRAVLCVPDGELPTSKARAMLPAQVRHADAAFNAGRAALLVEALSRRPEMLMAATEDRLHQDLRAPAMPATARLLHAIRRAGGAAVVSGAGPSLLVLGVDDEPAVAVGAALAMCGAETGRWRVLTPRIDTEGTLLTTEGAQFD
ncbi:MAG TPA: homoserine kinase [Kineosporiaceae bacterium]